MADLWKQIAQLLRGRPGWSLQAMASPGMPPVWCYEPGGEVELSVTVDEGSIRIYEMDSDQNVILADVDQLETWLKENRGVVFGERRAGVVDRLRGGGLFKWN